MKNTFQRKTAVLIFANSAEVDCREKTTIANLDVFNTLTEHTLKIVKDSQLPFFHFTEKEQHGSSFGERFSNAIKAVFEKGYENIITVGNDSPQLKTSHILEAEQQLQLGKTVLGPTLDGGFYLMGLHCSNFDPHLFKKLPWQRFGLFNKISKLIAGQHSYLFRLPVLQDIDNKEDAKALLNFFKTVAASILKVLKELFKPSFRIVSKNIQIFQSNFIALYYNKGSPVSMQFS
ncbi:DUF2064 domain-containing protein [Flagellimonas sp. HMM57]|uniref:TIGR04282 family arsenosugar biosynthesis glycosyltransferase n=1 Tax=unclassified Flagellimonas TaxID=2644544 RepID=UPI0013D3A1A8|nr:MULTISPECIES: DUF2064 domain-containing protein [unclassified Flagellimonas]UII77573.1 DUF2064 domain-containing protein [Flagellimonas sp. HMM57]